MKKLIAIFLLLQASFAAFTQAHLISWDADNSYFVISEVDLASGEMTGLGSSSPMSSQYDINEIYFDKAKNQIVALHQGADLWKYDLISETDALITLGGDTYKDLVVGPDKSYLLKWNSDNSNFEINEINLLDGSLTYIGASSTMGSEYDIDEIYFDEPNDQIVALYQDSDLWTYNLTSNTDAVIDLETDYYRDLTVTAEKSYLLKWNDDETQFEIKEIDLADGSISHVGNSSVVNSNYDINEIYFDASNSQVVGLYQGTHIWIYHLDTDTDELMELNGDTYRDFIVTTPANEPALPDPDPDDSTPDDPITDVTAIVETSDEIIKVYDTRGNELGNLEYNKTLILVYKSGAVKKVYLVTR